MESISLPKKISVNQDGANECKAEVAIEPLYPGYGATVANALRRGRW